MLWYGFCCPTSTALQRHYGILEALALGEDEMPDIKDETLPDEEGLSRYFFCLSIYMHAKLYTPFLFEIGNLVGDVTLLKQGTTRWKHNLLNAWTSWIPVGYIKAICNSSLFILFVPCVGCSLLFLSQARGSQSYWGIQDFSLWWKLWPRGGRSSSREKLPVVMLQKTKGNNRCSCADKCCLWLGRTCRQWKGE